MADTTTNKISVIDESGLDALLEAVFSALKGAYVSQNTFEDKVAEIIQKIGGGGMGFIAFDIRESDGHLIATYTGDEAPNMSINSNGHLIVSLE